MHLIIGILAQMLIAYPVSLALFALGCFFAIEYVFCPWVFSIAGELFENYFCAIQICLWAVSSCAALFPQHFLGAVSSRGGNQMKKINFLVNPK